MGHSALAAVFGIYKRNGQVVHAEIVPNCRKATL